MIERWEAVPPTTFVLKENRIPPILGTHFDGCDAAIFDTRFKSLDTLGRSHTEGSFMYLDQRS
jgi:hypothetical protein